MPNTNFQTIHQMGGAINSFVKQATGQDAVQNIDMEHITVAQNQYYEDVDISGRVVSFNAGAAGIPLEKCLIQIEPVQEGTGDPSPDNVRPISGWTGAKVTRTGKNLLPMTVAGIKAVNTSGTWSGNDYTINGVTFTIHTDSEGNVTGINVNGTASANTFFRITAPLNTYPQETLIANGAPSGSSTRSYCFLDSYSGRFNDIGNGSQFTNYGSTIEATIRVLNGTAVSNKVFKPMIRFASVTDATFVPYTGQTYSITFPSEAGTVCGGTLDVTTGELVVDRAIIASYNGETLPGEWISDRDVYASGATPTTGAQVVYELATPVTYTLTASEIRTLLGPNNIWADTGDIEVKFKNIKEFF